MKSFHARPKTCETANFARNVDAPRSRAALRFSVFCSVAVRRIAPQRGDSLR
jgi:hypothetical protein